MRHAVMFFAILLLDGLRIAHADGPLDPTFSYNDGAPYVYNVNSGDATAVTIALDPAGHLITGGYSSSGTTQLFVAKHRNADPIALDTSFGTLGVAASPFGSLTNNGAVQIAVDHHDRIVAAGYGQLNRACGAQLDHEMTYFAAARFINAGPNEGSADTTFGSGLFPGAVGSFVGTCEYTYSPVALLVGTNDEITVGGSAWNGHFRNIAMVRWNSSGTLDPSFGDSGVTVYENGAIDTVTVAMTQDTSGRILVLAYTRSALTDNAAVFRFNHDGSLDNSFGNAGVVVFPNVDGLCCITVDTLGRIVVAGSMSIPTTAPSQVFVARLTSSGVFDDTFGVAGFARSEIGGRFSQASALALDEHQRPIVSGQVANFGYPEAALVHFNLDGSLNAALGTGGVYTLQFGWGYSDGRSIVIDALHRPNVSIYASDRIGAIPAIVRYDELFGEGFD